MYIFRLFLIFFYFFVLADETIITIEPNGANLPDSSGSVVEGAIIYKTNCSECHGKSAEGRTAPELKSNSKLTGIEVSKTIGSSQRAFVSKYSIPSKTDHGNRNRRAKITPDCWRWK